MSTQKYMGHRVARLMAIQGLYQNQASNKELTDIYHDLDPFVLLGSYYEDETLAQPEAGLFLEIMEGVKSHQSDLDALLSRYLDADWGLDRLENIIKIILEAAIYEMMFKSDLHAHIIIDEYVGIAGAFYGDKEKRFINGVLHRISEVIRPNSLATES